MSAVVEVKVESTHVRVRSWSLLVEIGSLKWQRETQSVAAKQWGTEMHDEHKILDYNVQCVYFTALSKSSSKVYTVETNAVCGQE